LKQLRLLDLFSGIGGFSLGLERSAAFKTVAFCEIDPFCRKVLAKHWPEVPQYDDIRTLTADRLAADGIAVDAICGGFPCQDVSTAGRGLGLAGERSGLWTEFARLIRDIRPRFVFVENVAALVDRGLGRVLGDLAACGYDSEWRCISAADMGAAHERDRVWIIAHAASVGRQEPWLDWSFAVNHAAGAHWETSDALDAIRRGDVPAVCREADGLPHRSHRLRSLGNAVVPQIPELIGRAIAQAEGMTA